MTVDSIRAPDARDRRLRVECRRLMRPGVVVIAEDASVDAARRALLAHDVHALLVVGADGATPLGWVTARSVLGAGRSCATTPVRDAIAEDAVSVEPFATAADALALLLREEVSHVLVSTAARRLPEGVIGDRDMLRLLVD
jgi:CBS-domain-containing membrane protein